MTKTQKPLRRPDFDSRVAGDGRSRVSSSLKHSSARAAVRIVAAANVVVSNLGHINFPGTAFWGL